MGTSVRIMLPGKKGDYVDILEKIISGEMDRDAMIAQVKDIEESGDEIEIGSYSYLANFTKYLEQIAEKERNKFSDFVIHVLRHGNEFTLHHDDVLTFYRGLKVLEESISDFSNKNFKRTFSDLLRLFKKYVKMEEPHATIEFG